MKYGGVGAKVWGPFLLLVFLSISCNFGVAQNEGSKGPAVELNEYTKALRRRFEDSFVDKCQKYPFVKQWGNLLENSSDRYVTFMYHEPGLRNGGLGDRIGGLLNAIGIALRFNRTLLIESKNDFHNLFRPYHPTLLANGDEDMKTASTDYKYSWKKEDWAKWSNWSRKYADHDSTEYDMWFCVNNVAWRNPICSMDDGDVEQKHIKIRGNRNYMCKWATHKDILAHKEFLMRIAPEGVTNYESINLMEVAGCMMRLAMWPTEELWQYVSISMESHMGKENVKVPSSLQVGAHFRCGDSASYLKTDNNACIHDVDGKHPHPESSYMGAGTPNMIGECVKDIINKPFEEISLSDIKVAKKKEESAATTAAAVGSGGRLRSLSDIPQRVHSTNGTMNRSAYNKNRRSLRGQVAQHLRKLEEGSRVVYIASDNQGSAQQINATANHPLAVVSPEGCHVELDPSFDCSQLTIGYWLLLSSSDVIVTQTDATGSPISAFSRYAAVYGLKGDSLRDAKDCTNIKSFYDISRRWTGNWFCD